MISHGDDTYKYSDIRLNFSSNVYSGFCHEGLFRHLASRLDVITSYPEPEPYSLERIIASKLGIEPYNVMVTNGATEAIYLIAQAFANSVSYIEQPTFSEYKEACRIYGHKMVSSPSDNTELFWICNPNNPTGTVTPKENITACIDNYSNTIFVLDHSYACFTDLPMLSPAETVAMPNVLMLHSMTKEYAVPGIRLGFVTGPQHLITRLRRMRMPWSVNAIAIEAGLYLMEHHHGSAIDIATLHNERMRVSEALKATGGIDVMDSDTHILLCKLHHGTAAELKDRLANEHGILIRDASNFTGLSPQHFRIAVQVDKDANDELISKIKHIINHEL